MNYRRKSNHDQSQPTTRDTVRYFNTHTEGLGFINNIKEVPVKGSNDVFYSVQFTMLEGNPDAPDKVYISLTIPAEQVLQQLDAHWQAINDENTPVFVGVRLAKFRAEAFAYSQSSQTPGKLGVNYSARLISIHYLKIGDKVIISPKGDIVDGSGRRADNATENQPSHSPSLSQTPSSRDYDGGNGDNNVYNNSEWSFDRPLFVELRQDDPDFEATKTRLKMDGYRWFSDRQSWVIPYVKFEKDDPKFQSKLNEVKQLGYRWDNKERQWYIPFQARSHHGRPQHHATPAH